MNIQDKITATAEAIAGSELILFITGAGISADSGLPTYRGMGGLYDGNATDDGYTIEEALSSDVMFMHPEITWKYLWQIGAACFKARPNRAHLLITEIQRLKPETWVLTQNIDGLHRAAGNRNLIEIHGNAFELYCIRCGGRAEARDILYSVGKDVQLPPKCEKCGGILRPDVVLFGEMLPDIALGRYYEVLARKPDMVISIGTSAMFQYITSPVYDAARRGRFTVEINPVRSNMSEIVSCHIPMTAANAMEAIWGEMR